MRDKLSKDILIISISYLALQFLIFSSFAIPTGFFARYIALFSLVSLVFHGVIAAMLFIFKQDFVLESTGEKLERVNAANRITLLRVSTLPTLLFLVIAAKDYRIRIPLLLLVVFVFLTDFADGYVSRKRGQITRVGRMMDSASDYSLIIVLTTVFCYFQLIPIWLFALIVGRLLLQGIFVSIIALSRKKAVSRATFMGKTAVASIMVLYALEVLKLVVDWRIQSVLSVAELIVGAIVAVSVADKCLAFAKDLAIAATEEPQAAEKPGMAQDKTA